LAAAVIARVISGGQTGVDIAGLRAARAAGLPTGGTAPAGYATEVGPQPELLQGFGLVAHASRRYPARTLANVLEADVTLVIADPLDGGSALTVAYARENGRPVLHLADLDAAALERAADFIVARHRQAARPIVLNIAGNRESKQPGIEARAAPFLRALFAQLKGPEAPGG
jgi:hypothetical protein